MRKKSWQVYKTLFTSTFYISSFTFGGGFVILPLLEKRFVKDLKWIEHKEMLDLIAIAQSSPGAIAVNTAIIIGYRVAGILGALVAMLGTVLPPFLIIVVVSFFYETLKENKAIHAILTGMQAGIGAIILSISIQMFLPLLKKKKIYSILFVFLAFLASFCFKINTVVLLLLAAFIGSILSLFEFLKKENTK